jgi:hypothetical protein
VKKKLNREKFGKTYHPLRERIVRAIDATENGVMSPNQLSIALDEPLGNVSYHVKTLRDDGCVELIKTEPRRGAVEHFYRVTDGILTEDKTSEALKRIAKLMPKGAVGKKGVLGAIAQELCNAGFHPDKIDGDELAEAA